MNVGDEHQAVVVQVKSKLDSAREAHERTMSALKLELKAVQMDVMNVQASNQEHDSKRTVSQLDHDKAADALQVLSLEARRIGLDVPSPATKAPSVRGSASASPVAGSPHDRSSAVMNNAMDPGLDDDDDDMDLMLGGSAFPTPSNAMGAQRGLGDLGGSGFPTPSNAAGRGGPTPSNAMGGRQGLGGRGFQTPSSAAGGGSGFPTPSNTVGAGFMFDADDMSGDDEFAGLL